MKLLKVFLRIIEFFTGCALLMLGGLGLFTTAIPSYHIKFLDVVLIFTFFAVGLALIANATNSIWGSKLKE